MKVFNSVTISIATGEVLHEDSFEYDGPIAHCGGGGKGGGGQTTAMSAELEAMMKQIFQESTPARQEFWSQASELLKTGGVGAYIPMIAKAEEQTRSATSKSLQQLDDRLAMFNWAGMPHGEEIRAGARQAGEISAANIGPEFYKSMLPSIINAMMGTGTTVVQGMGAGLDATSRVEAADIGGQYGLWQALMPQTSIQLK